LKAIGVEFELSAAALLVLLVVISSVTVGLTAQPSLQEWQINGIVAA
jgi:hypothetical protein